MLSIKVGAYFLSNSLHSTDRKYISQTISTLHPTQLAMITCAVWRPVVQATTMSAPLSAKVSETPKKATTAVKEGKALLELRQKHIKLADRSEHS